jgi:hypothetical protein
MANRPVSGGGINSRVVKSVSIKPGAPTTNVVSVRGTSELGYASGGKLTREGSHTSTNVSAPLFERKVPEQALGNQLVNNIGQGGPGAGRTTYRSGYQGQRGSGGSPEPSGRPWYQDFPNPGMKEGR